MSNFMYDTGSDFNDPTIQYAGMTPLQIVDKCVSDGKLFTILERDYCSNYFVEQFALIDADIAVVSGESFDPMFDDFAGMTDVPAYAQERKDMYDSIDRDFPRRTNDLFIEYNLAQHALRCNTQLKSNNLVDSSAMSVLQERGLCYYMSMDSNPKPSDIVKEAVSHKDITLTPGDAYVCNSYVQNALFADNRLHTEESKADLDAAIADVKEAQQMLSDFGKKTNSLKRIPMFNNGQQYCSVLNYQTIGNLKESGYSFDIKGATPDSLFDSYEPDPVDLVNGAIDANIKWDEKMQNRVDKWMAARFEALEEKAEDPAGYDRYNKHIVDKVLSAESLASASESSLFERSTQDGVFANGSKVKLYSRYGESLLRAHDYDEISKEFFDNYLDDMRQKHMSGASTDNRVIANSSEILKDAATKQAQSLQEQENNKGEASF